MNEDGPSADAARNSHSVGPMEETQSVGNFATVEGIRLHFVEQGSGAPVVLLHGFASSLDVWNGVIPQLARRHRTVALDLKGFGASDRSAGDYSPGAQATLVWALLDHAYARVGVQATLLERDFNIPPLPKLLAEIEQIRAIQARHALPEQRAHG